MKEIKIPIISGLSIAATLALMPIQVLAKDGQATVKDTNGHPGNFYNSSGKNFSGGFESSAGTYGQNDNNIVTINGVNSGGQPMWDYTIYGGGNGDGTPTTPPFYYKQTSAAENNTLNVYNGATVAVLVGGEGKGAKNNTVNLIDADVNNVVLGGNGTWYGQADSSGDATYNIVNISGSTQVKYNNFTNFNSTSVMGGRATGTSQANNNEVNISGTPTIAGKIAGAAVENGSAEGNKVTITGAVTLGNGNTTVNGVIASVSNTATLKDNTVTFDNENAKMIGNAGVFGANGNNAGIHDPAGKATAEGNGVILRNGSIESDGGMAGSYMVTTSKNNYSNISGGYVRAYVYGGYSRADGYTSENDHVIMSGGKVDGGVYGNWNLKGSIKNGYVTMSGGEVGASDGVYGGWSDVAGGDVTESHVDISGTAKINGRAVGGRSDAKNVTKSYITATGGTIGKEAIGGEGKTGASENYITATGTTFKKSVIGGKSSNGAVTGSRVFLTSSKVGENIYGGNAAGGKVEDNHVKLRGNNVVTGEIYGGTSTTNDASRNIVDIEDGEVGGTIFGGRGVNSFNNTVNLTRTHAKNQVNGGGVNTSGGSVHDNKVTLDSAKVDGIVSGGQANSGDATKNIVTAQNNSKINSVIGGQSSSGAAKLNEVHLSDSAATKEIYGGYSISNNAEENIVNLTNTTANDEVYGGLSSQKAADKNTVKLNGGEAKKNVWGGYGRTSTSQNTVTVEGGALVAGNALGAEATAGSATNNTVNVDSGKVTGDVKGAKASGSATNNIVNLKGTARVDGNVYAADASSGSGNSVNFHSGSVGGTIYGLSNASGTNNTLNVHNAHTQKTAGDIKNFNALNFDGVTAATNGTIDKAALNLTTNVDTDINNAKFKLNGEEYDVNKDTYGSLNIEEGKEYHLIRNTGNTFTNFTEKAKQTTNEFTLKNSTTYDIMLKGLIKSSDDQSILIQGNKLTSRKISNDGKFDGGEINKYGNIPNPVINVVNENPSNPTDFNGLDIDGGNNSTVNLTGGNNIGNITGGAGSTLNVGKDTTNPAAPNSITAKNIGGFDDINIFMPPTVKDGDSMIKLTDPTANTDLSNMRGKITAYVSGNTDVGDTSTIHLIDKQGSGRLLLPDPSHLQTRVQQGATIDYETYAMVDANGRALDLRFSGKRRVKDDTKSFAETRAASLASLKSGSELITNYLDKLIPDGHLELFPFAISEAYDLRYETGSHVNSKGYGVAAGLASLTENFAGDILSGVFVEYGKANYDSYLDSGLHADGDSEYIGGGLMLKQNFTSGTYLDASFHVGKISSDYNSNDWTYAIAPGVLAHNEKFDISSTYMATHIGIGQIFDLSQSNKLDVYTKWLYAYTDDADASISSGERYHFDSVTSNRLRAGLRDTINLKDEHNLYFGGAYEYEFSGDAKASTMGLDAPKPSLKGSTGVFEAGYKYESKNLIFSLGGKGYVGKTRGGAINAGFEIMF